MRSTASVAAMGFVLFGAAPLRGAAGSFDPTFGDGGRVTTDLGFFAFAQAVVQQPDG